ncbi:MAG: thiamine-phosphate kinase [Dehalococcoidia bacterium]|nr:thiamine-phosphate kinase [Dehalococcoidia bacterium]
MKVSELGEFELIARIKDELGAQEAAKTAMGRHSRLLLGIGDDAALWQSPSSAQIATTDTLVAGVHFPEGRVPWADLGWKALAVNVSDVAAMGGTPEYALVTLGLPSDFAVEDVLALYRGMADLGKEYGVVIAGGDLVRASRPFVTVALWGRATESQRGEPLFLSRDAAHAGDLIAVTGVLGNAAGGLRLLTERRPAPRQTVEYLRRAYLRPRPQVDLGRALVIAGVRCAIDVSDGLGLDLGHICEESQLGARVRVDQLPVSDQLKSAFPEEALTMAVGGGEDYELLFTGPARIVDRVRGRFATPITVVGEMVEDGERRPRFLDDAGNEMAFERAGWEHFFPESAR